MYKISVITPFHNVDMDMFRSAYESMLAQTIGFENIEWIIVVHNCNPEYMPALQDMLGTYDNVLLKELNNDARTPSSPRNYGVTFATAQYIGYLDGDDSYLPDCLEVSLRNALETQSQIVCFRREYMLESESLSPLTEIVLWNQLQERIVIERGHWDMKKMFSGIWAMVTSKIFERQFLLEHNIIFDEEVPYCEDGLYCILAMAQADRICYLPQLIGYHYFINGNSLVQSLNKPSETLLRYAKGMAKLIGTAYDFGIDINEFSQILMSHECNFIIHSDVTEEDHKEITRLLAPYIVRTTMVEPYKLMSKEESEYLFNVIRDVILNPREGWKASRLVDQNDCLSELLKILARNKDTDYGVRYRFSEIRDLASFRSSVPLTLISAYKKLTDLQIKIGEKDILCSDEIQRYVISEDRYVIPFTSRHIKPYVSAFGTLLKGNRNLLLAQWQSSGYRFNDNTSLDTMESMIVRMYMQDVMFDNVGSEQLFCSPASRFFSETESRNFEGFLLDALADKDITQIVAFKAETIQQMFEYFEADADRIIALLSQKAPERAREISDILSSRGWRGVGKLIWPNIKRVVACGSGNQSFAREQVKSFMGNVSWNNGYYFTLETVMGKALFNDSDLYELDRNACFYEFFCNDIEDARPPVPISGLEPGHTYNVIVTNDSGLYRLMTNYEIRAVSNDASRTVVEFI